MKNVLCAAAVAAALLTPGPANAQAPKQSRRTPKNTLTFNSVAFFVGALPFEGRDGEDLMGNNLGVYAVEYERALSGRVSAYVAPALISFTRGYGGYLVSGFGADLGLRYFIVGEAPGGFWASAGLNAKTYSGTYGTSLGGPGEEKTSSFGAGAMLGYTFLPLDVLDISIGAGGGMNSLTWSDNLASDDFPRSVEDVVPVLLLRLSAGVAF
jgi:opacity protein-like surface antigen